MILHCPCPRTAPKLLLHLVHISSPVCAGTCFILLNVSLHVSADTVQSGEAVLSALHAAHKLINERHEGCVTYWRFRASKSVAPLPSELPPYGSTCSSAHGAVSSDDDDMVRRRQGEKAATRLFLHRFAVGAPTFPLRYLD